jgi:phycobilisome rod-core linker protein
MALPLLQYPPSSQNPRVTDFDIPGDEQFRIFSTDNILSDTDMGNLIDSAYRQIFFHAFECNRERVLESQLRNGQITVRDFVRGLMVSKTFIESFYDKNSNYRFVEHCIEKALGRLVYSEREKIAWSAVVMTKGVAGFVDELLNSDEYLNAFGYNVVPYQRRRITAGRSEGQVRFNIKSPRYGAYHRAKLGFPQTIWQTVVGSYVAPDRKPKTGDPAEFLKMARGIKSGAGNPSRVSTANINIEASIPRR